MSVAGQRTSQPRRTWHNVLPQWHVTFHVNRPDDVKLWRRLLLQFVVNDLRVRLRAGELLIDGYDVTFELRRNLVFCGSLIDSLPCFHLIPSKGNEVLAEVGIFLQLIKRSGGYVAIDYGIDVFDRSDNLSQR